MSSSDIRHLDREAKLAVYSKVVDLAQGALKSTMLINGGGAVALLAFIGTLWDNGIGRTAFLSLTCAISSFALGVLTGAIAAVCFFYSEFMDSGGPNSFGDILTKCGNYSIIFSLIFFFCGILISILTLICHAPQP